MTNGRMKAAVVRAVGVLTVEEVPVPTPGDYAVLCRNLYGTTCSATDQHIIDQTIPFEVKLPTMLGHETIGRIIARGPKVRYLPLGDRVTRTILPPMDGLGSGWGGYAEYGLAYDWRAMKEDGLPEKEWRQWMRCSVIDDDIPDEVAPMLITWRETHSFITRMGIKPGMRVLIIGTGGNGLAFTEHTVWEGGEATVVGSPGREASARACGAEAFISYRDGDCAERILDAARGGFDMVVDAVGNQRQTNMAIAALKRGGVAGVYGINERVTMPEGDYRRHDGSYLEGETHERVVEGVRAGAYRADIFYDATQPYPLDKIGDVFDMLRARTWPKALVRL